MKSLKLFVIVCKCVQVCPCVCPLSPHATIWFMVFIHNISIELFSKNFITVILGIICIPPKCLHYCQWDNNRKRSLSDDISINEFRIKHRTKIWPFVNFLYMTNKTKVILTFLHGYKLIYECPSINWCIVYSLFRIF